MRCHNKCTSHSDMVVFQKMNLSTFPGMELDINFKKIMVYYYCLRAHILDILIMKMRVL